MPKHHFILSSTGNTSLVATSAGIETEEVYFERNYSVLVVFGFRYSIFDEFVGVNLTMNFVDNERGEFGVQQLDSAHQSSCDKSQNVFQFSPPSSVATGETSVPALFTSLL